MNEKNLQRILILVVVSLLTNLIGFSPVMAQDTQGLIKRERDRKLNETEPNLVTTVLKETKFEKLFADNSVNTTNTSLKILPEETNLTVMPENGMAQINSVSQLSDVQPTDWAFQALQSLVERYGVIAGYPDGTFQGNRPITRYEFAAGLNAALNRINELIAAGNTNLISKEDLPILQRLQDEFAAELAILRGRVETLEARTAKLEANQFSTTTKLNAEVITAVTDTFGDRVGRNSDGSNTLFGYRIRFNFETSFTGKDLLRTRLEPSNFGPVVDVTGTNMTRLNFDVDTESQVILAHIHRGDSRGWLHRYHRHAHSPNYSGR